MSAEIVNGLLNTEVINSSKIPVEHLDYDYIQKCTDVGYLEKILKVLRSGEEGIYPHLIDFCEKHVEKLNPRSRALRKDKPAASAASLPKDEWSQISEELESWETEMRAGEVQLKQLPLFGDEENVPPIRGSNCSVQSTSASGVKKNKNKAPCPRDYKDWDKFDVEKECAKVDEVVTNDSARTVINHSHPKIKTNLHTSVLTEQEKVVLANREKDKGNEAFKTGDYEEALAYYSRSLSILPTVAAYNNRAQAEIKLQNWHKALSDCQKVLELEPANAKGLLRRATVQKHLGNLQLAVDDVNAVLHIEPHNEIAKKLLNELSKKMAERVPEKPAKRQKMLIEEIEEEEEEKEHEARDGAVDSSSRQRAGGESCAAAATGEERGDMGNAQKKPHGRGDGGGGGRGGCSADKYTVTPPKGEEGARKGLANGNSAAHQAEKADRERAEQSKVNLDAPAGNLPPRLARLKNEGNHLFKNGQFGDAIGKYSQAIDGYTEAGVDSPEDLCILYSNRAACYLKDGNSSDCITDCTKSLELQPFSLKPLLRRAMAYESLERYRNAYVDYKTVLQIDIGTQAAHDSVNRITRMLIEQDGPEWREKLPEIPMVPLSAQQHRREEPPSAEEAQARAERATQEAARKAEARFTLFKSDGNEFVKKGRYEEAVGKYSECLKLKSNECAIYTNRALCFVKLDRFAEAKQDCDAALALEPENKKAFYRRALANKGLKDYLACSTDLQEVLRLDSSVAEAERELQEVTELLRQSLAAAASPGKARRSVPITEVDDTEEAATKKQDTTTEQNHVDQAKSIAITQPANAYEFGQALSVARSHDDTAACAELLRLVAPETLPSYVSTYLDGHTLAFIMQALDDHLLDKEPGLVYQHLNHLHTAERFSMLLMLLDKDKRRQMTQLFEHLSAVESEDFSQNDVQNLANKYI
ncbi:sperm-associated antigen 1 [Alosa sapidissima]|uniref:sperm-associated antigen 1 n=1 Tax=Alosa sapidissima TaxID=34773 RepID=UPI001C087F62|nr:sperm-associated antigen 1 [Alosa sapidissima]